MAVAEWVQGERITAARLNEIVRALNAGGGSTSASGEMTRATLATLAGSGLIPATVAAVTVAGYAAAGDGGAARYAHVPATSAAVLPGSASEGARYVVGGKLYTYSDGAWNAGHALYLPSLSGYVFELDEVEPSLAMVGCFGVAPSAARTSHTWPTVAHDALAALQSLSAYIVARHTRGNIRVENRQYWLSAGFVGADNVGMVGDLVPLLADDNEAFAVMGCTFFCSGLNPAITLENPPDLRNIAVVNALVPNIAAKRWITTISNSSGTLTVNTSGPHNFVAGVTSVVIAGTAKYNGTYTVLTTTQPTRFTVSYTGGNTGGDSGGTATGTTAKGITTVSAATNYEPVGFEEYRAYADAFSGQGFKVAPGDFSRIENIRFYNFNVGCEIDGGKGLSIANAEGDGRSNGFILKNAGQGASVQRAFVKPRIAFDCEDFEGIGIASMSAGRSGKIKVTLTVPIYYDATAANDKLGITGATAGGGYVINKTNWKVTPYEDDPYSVDLDQSVYASATPLGWGSATATVQPVSSKYRVGATSLANNGSGGVRVTCAWPHLITGTRRLTLVEAYGTAGAALTAAKLWLEEKEFRANPISATTFDLLAMDGTTPIAWDANLSSITAVCAYFFGSMREGVGHTWDNIDASRVYDSWAWGFTTGHYVDTGMVNFFSSGRGEEGTYCGPNSIGWHIAPGSNGIRIIGGETANAGLSIKMDTNKECTIVGTHIASGASGVTIRQDDGYLTLIGCTIAGPRGSSRSVASLGASMASLQIFGRTELTGIIADAADRLKRVYLHDALESEAFGQTSAAPLVLRPPGADVPVVLNVSSDDADDVDVAGAIVSGDRTLNPNLGLTVGANGGASAVTKLQLRRQGTLHANDEIGSVDFYGRMSSTRVDTMARAANVVTITTKWAHGLLVGDNVTIGGADAGTYAGTFAVASVPTTTSFTYAQVAADAAVSSPAVATAVVGSINGDTYARVLATAVDPTSGSEDGKLALQVKAAGAGTLVSVLAVDGDAARFDRAAKLKSYTTAQRDALTVVEDGYLILNTTIPAVQARVAGAWVSL